MEKIIKIYDQEEYKTLLPGLKQIHLHKIETFNEPENQEIAQQPLKDLSISNTLTCSYCKINFDDCIQQRQHYKSDWHRYNLKQNLKKVDAITEEQFEQLADDVSSISGSDDTDDDNSDKINVLYQGKVYFKNDSGKVFSLYRSLIHEKKDVPSCEEHLLKIVRQCMKQTYWTLLMIGGGHFAGAVYNGDSVVVHKTFHLYTCRAKQGGAQYKEGNARSAGASLRRYNELNLNLKIAELLETWREFIDNSNLIFYRAAGPFNRTALFGGKSPVLKKNDPRLRLIPFCTKRATFTELKRVYDVLTNVEIYGSVEYFKNKSDEGVERSRNRENPIKNKNINRAKSRESKEFIRPIPVLIPEDSSDDSELVLNTSDVDVSFENLKEFNGTRKNKQKKPKKKDRIKKWEETLKKNLNEACIKGNIQVLKKVLDSIKEDVTELEENQMTATKALNLPIDLEGNTVLHVAALNNHNDLITWLMENDSSPCNRNDKLHTPYTVNADKSVRNVFRCFATNNPEKYNYAKSQIPIVATTLTEEELTEKKKALRKAKREREKERRKENDIKRIEEENKQRYLKLSDREKRALAAERRILAQTAVVLVRCFLCGEDISGKVPFEYSGNRFCSITCLKAHRMQQPVVLS